MFEPGGEFGGLLQVGIVGGFGLAGVTLPIGSSRRRVVEPVDPFERGIVDGLGCSSRPAPMDQFSFVEPVDRLDERHSCRRR